MKKQNEKKIGHVITGGSIDYEIIQDDYTYGDKSVIPPLLEEHGYGHQVNSHFVCLKESADFLKEYKEEALDIMLSANEIMYMVTMGSGALQDGSLFFNDQLISEGRKAILTAAIGSAKYSPSDGLSQIIRSLAVLPLLPDGAHVMGHEGVIKPGDVQIDGKGYIKPESGLYLRHQP